jgi:hypothetical protein
MMAAGESAVIVRELCGSSLNPITADRSNAAKVLVVPGADSNSQLLNHLIGERAQRRRDREPERRCGFEVDDELDFRRLLDSWRA